MSSNAAYWSKRALLREQESADAAEKLLKELDAAYRDASESIRRDIESFYARYMKDYGVSYAEAVKSLTYVERKDWEQRVKNMIAEIDAKSEGWELLKQQLDAESFGARISILEARTKEIQLRVDSLMSNAHNKMRDTMVEAYSIGYYKTAFDLAVGTGLGHVVKQLDDALVERVMSYPWSGADFSQRLWKNREALNFHIRETMTQGLIRGDGVDVMARELSEKMNSSFKAAKRLVHTEAGHFHSEGTFQTYRERGIEKYEFLATLELKTCSICQTLDKQVFEVSKTKEGENAPPMHPACRCTTTPYVEGLKGERVARGLDGKTYPVDRNMSYSEWHDAYVTPEDQAKYDQAQKDKRQNREDQKQYERYKKVLGAENLPKSFRGFSNAKYNQTDKWINWQSQYRSEVRRK